MATPRDGTGQSATFTDFGVVVGWGSPDVLTITDNALFPRPVLPKAVKVNKLRATVQTAPVGADLLIDIYLGTIATGALDGAPIATITIAAGTFSGSTTLTPVSWPVTKFAVPAITQVGSGTPGSTAFISAECQVDA